MNTSPVTVLVPARNPHRGYLREAFGSILEQSAKTWEAILVTDPDDRSLDHIDLPDSRFTKVVNTGSRLSGAINAGMRAARNPFVTLLLADDRLEPMALEILGRAIVENPTVDYFHSSVRCIDADNQPVGPVRTSRSARTERDFLTHAVTHLMCWRVAKAASMGGVDETLGLHGADDYDFPWSMWEAGARFMNLAETLYVYRIHSDHFRLTTHVPRSVQVAELVKIFRKHRLPEGLIKAEIDSRVHGYLTQALLP